MTVCEFHAGLSVLDLRFGNHLVGRLLRIVSYSSFKHFKLDLVIISKSFCNDIKVNPSVIYI